MDRVSKLIKENVEMVAKLEPQEFIGVCKILGIKLTTQDNSNEEVNEEGNAEVLLSVRPAEELIEEVVDRIGQLNRTQGRNLRRLLKAATKESR